MWMWDSLDDHQQQRQQKQNGHRISKYFLLIA